MEMCQKDDMKKRGRDSCIVATFGAVWDIEWGKASSRMEHSSPNTKAWQ